jgi:hypothetical protein
MIGNLPSEINQHADISSSRPPPTDLEKRAAGIYVHLRSFAELTNRFTYLKGFRNAVTYLPASKSYLEISDFTPDNENADYFRKLGFNDVQITKGITSIWRGEMICEDPDNHLGDAKLNRTNSRVTYVASSGGEDLKVIDEEAGKGQERALDTDEALAMGTMDELRKIVHEIGDKYGGYDEFDKTLRKTNPRPDVLGINYVDKRGVILYNGGLPLFVQTYLEAKSGKPSADSTARMIRS